MLVRDPRMGHGFQDGQPPPPPQHHAPRPHPWQSGAPPQLAPPPPPPSQPPPPGPQLHLRLILNRDEAGYLFGFDGVLLEQLRQQTGANLFITDPGGGGGGPPEQVLTISGSLELIFKAFSLVCRKLWDFISSLPPPVGGAARERPLVLRLAVPASQCGSIIGKHGAKVKEIRDLTGANIQVAQEGLPDSTERCVEISGTGEACLQCAYHICVVLQDAPIRGEVVPYVPGGGVPGGGAPSRPADDGWKPVFLCGDKAYVIVDGGVAAPAPPELLRRELAKTPLGDMAESLATLSVNNFGRGQAPMMPQQQQQQQQPMHPQQPDYMNPLSLMQAISSAQQQNASSGGPAAPQTSREMPVSAEMVGVIVGKGGAKMGEIRRISGAQLHVPAEEQLTPEQRSRPERVITISGTQESILLAQFLIQSNIDMAIKDSVLDNGGPGPVAMPQQHQNGGGIMMQQQQQQPSQQQQQQQPRRFHNDPRRRDSGGGGGGFRR